MRTILPAILLIAVTVLLAMPVEGEFRLAPMLEPWNGLYRTAREARPATSFTLRLEGMDGEARVEYDSRGVPHIYSDSDRDATMAMGYVVARDRLFQMEFIYRAATGRLSAMLGEGALDIDRHFRRIGMAQAIARNTQLLPERQPREAEIARWYTRGANAWIETLGPSEYPLEYRLLGATPSMQTIEYTMALLAYMTYDLTFRNSDTGYSRLKEAMGEEEFERLYPEFDLRSVPIIPSSQNERAGDGASNPANEADLPAMEAASQISWANLPEQAGLSHPPVPFEGFVHGKGSNNWAVAGNRSTSGRPILAGDMHLGLTLPSIWYEAHIVTPSRNVYGVTFPSAPAIVEGFTPTTGWTFTNTGTDQLDRYVLTLDETRTRYRYGGKWRDLEFIPDSIQVRNRASRVDTLIFSHHGPVEFIDGVAIATRWIGHEFGSTFSAVWEMNQATDYPSFESAIRKWDYPMQNILYAGSDDVIAIRSTGWLPIRGVGNAFGLLDGSDPATDWQGRVAFEDLPFSYLPVQGTLSSTNQRPTDASYPYYLGQDWYSEYRSIRINQLLGSKRLHSASDLASYQADIRAVQADLFLPWLREIEGLSDAADSVRQRLLEWNREMSIDQFEPVLLMWFMESLTRTMWDEPVFAAGPNPDETRILDLLTGDPTSHWFDITITPELQETWQDVFAAALESVAGTWAEEDHDETSWGERHHLLLRHITQNATLQPLWRGPFPVAGWRETLSPSPGNPATSGASWRMVVDFGTSPPTAVGVYPGGQSGNPFSRHYDAHVGQFLDFDYFPLSLAPTPEALRKEHGE